MPASFTDSVRRRLRRLPPVGRELLELCALLGTRDASVLAAALERSTEEVVEVLGRAVDLQLMVADQTSFRFRHALTRDAILAGLPPDVRRLLARRARSAVEKIHPGLPGAWCRLAAELSRLSCEPAKAAALLVTAASRAVSDGALKTATDDLEQAWTLAPAGSSVALDVEELRTRVAGLAGDLDSAMEHAGRLLMQVVDPVRRARVHLQLAEAASAASRWTLAREELSAARPLVEDAGGLAAIDALTAQVMLGAAHVAEAETSAHRALEVSERLGLADPACQALEVLGRIQRNRDMHQAEDVFTRQLELASRHGAKLWELRAMHELGTIDLLHANETARLCRARELATDAGAVVTTATIDLQLGMSGWLRFDAATCVDRARRCQDAARRFRLELLLAEALLLEAAGHGFAGRRAAMELAITEARATGRPEADLEASAWAHRAGYSLFREDRTAAIAALDTAISILRDAETVYVRPYWRTWALLRTVEANDGDAARAEARRVMAGDSRLSAAIIGYGDAVAGGRSGAAGEAEELFELARASASAPGFTAQRHLAERLVAECALVDGWGRPTRWLAEAEVFFSSSDQPHVARACRSLLRRAGVPPVRRVCATPIPPVLAALGISAREADVLELISEGLTSRQVAERLFISVRTVDKHVERLLQKTGVTRRAELRAFRT